MAGPESERSNDSDASVIFDPRLRHMFPAFYNALEQGLCDYNIVSSSPDLHSDHTPKMQIPYFENKGRVVIPGFISGSHAEEAMVTLAKLGHTLRYHHPQDDRTPWARELHYLFADMEMRGNKPTKTKEGGFDKRAELHYAPYLAHNITGPGLADSATFVDPHDKWSVDAFGIPSTILTVLPDMYAYAKEQGIFDGSEELNCVDEGATGRTLFFSELSGFPIAMRQVKQRVDGVVSMQNYFQSRSLEDKTVLLIDDVLATGSTIFQTGKRLKQEFGAQRVIALLTHTKGVAAARPNILRHMNGATERAVDVLVLANTTPYANELSHLSDVHIVDVMPLMVKAARAALDPTAAHIASISPYRFPLASNNAYIKRLHDYNPELAPDHDPRTYVPDIPQINGKVVHPYA